MVVYWAINCLISGDMRHLEHRFILVLNLFQFNQRMVGRALVEVIYLVIIPFVDRPPSYFERHRIARHPRRRCPPVSS